MPSWYDAWADRYDDWSTRVTGDVPFYVGLARAADGPLVSLPGVRLRGPTLILQVAASRT